MPVLLTGFRGSARWYCQCAAVIHGRWLLERIFTSRSGFWNKVVSAGKRVLTGESLFMTTFTNTRSQGREHIAFAAPYMGRITPMHLDQMGGELICQKGAFLCGAKGIQVSIAFQKKMGVGLFGGEGLFIATVTGPGPIWLQSLPFSRLAGSIVSAAGGRGKHTEEGSVLGGLGGMLMGSNNQ